MDKSQLKYLQKAIEFMGNMDCSENEKEDRGNLYMNAISIIDNELEWYEKRNNTPNKYYFENEDKEAYQCMAYNQKEAFKMAFKNIGKPSQSGYEITLLATEYKVKQLL